MKTRAGTIVVGVLVAVVIGGGAWSFREISGLRTKLDAANAEIVVNKQKGRALQALAASRLTDAAKERARGDDLERRLRNLLTTAREANETAAAVLALVSVSPSQRPNREAPDPVRGPITSDPVIINYCAKEWGDNYKMVAYCRTQQQEAKDTLDRGNTYRIDWTAYATIKRKCESEWPGNYRMRVYCEGQQAQAYQAVSSR